MIAVISVGYGCAGGASEAGPPARPTPMAASADPAPQTPPPPEVTSPEVDGRIQRAELLPVLEAGLGRFLQGVETRPHVVDDRFVGFELVRLWPDDPRFAEVDLQPGDVILRINGQPIERPGQALQVWNGLRVASALYIEYRRDGERRELRFAIVD